MIVRRLVCKHFKIVDEAGDIYGSLAVEDGLIKTIIPGTDEKELQRACLAADLVIDGRAIGPGAALMPAFIDLHAHFREPAFPPETVFSSETALPSETGESASLAAAAGGYGTVVCMANTRPAIDTIAKARAMRERVRVLGLIDLYPALSLTKNMEGRELSEIQNLPVAANSRGPRLPLLLSEDGKDLADDTLFLAAMAEARRLGAPVSCHCDFGGPEAEAAKAAGRPRAEWSRIEEYNAVRRAINLGKQADCHVHIAHVSTKEAVHIIRNEKLGQPENSKPDIGFYLTCEASPHHIGAAEDDARRMGDESFGRVNPPLRSGADQEAVIAAIRAGIVDAIATDHAPHSPADKAAGAPGFAGLETAFPACYTKLVLENGLGLPSLSRLMSAAPAKILGLADRGRIAPGLRADLVIAETESAWKVDPEQFKSRGKSTPFAGRELRGKILMTINRGRIVFEENVHDV
jgi:dihydroorotase